MKSNKIKNTLDSMPLNGSKSYLLGFAMLAIGIGGLILHWFGHEEYSLTIKEARDLIFLGWATIGFSHKWDKGNET